MQGLSKQEKLANLRDRIETIEKRPLLESVRPLGPDKASFLATPPGLLHEVFADDQRAAGAALGFTLGQARLLQTPQRRAVLILQLGYDGQTLGIPYGVGLAGFGIDPDCIVLVRAATPVELLWAMEEALACRAVAAVIAEIGTPMKAFDFTASRRLGLRTAASGSSAFVLRYTREREASAARLRWRVIPVGSQPPPFDERAPGRARWRVRLEKGGLEGKLACEGTEFLVDWTANGFVLNDSKGDDARLVGSAALSAAAASALGDRLSQAR